MFLEKLLENIWLPVNLSAFPNHLEYLHSILTIVHDSSNSELSGFTSRALPFNFTFYSIKKLSWKKLEYNSKWCDPGWSELRLSPKKPLDRIPHLRDQSDTINYNHWRILHARSTGPRKCFQFCLAGSWSNNWFTVEVGPGINFNKEILFLEEIDGLVSTWG